ncbi:hypothetical protein [Rhizobium sp. OAE497]|uniref:hypothetical protein n=1 Tax=Rhizobium sp. OAE497 TaxID=2663796 RepID=UPI00339A458E
MDREPAETEKGKDASRGLMEQAAKEEKEVEARKGSDLSQGADRVAERSRSSEGKGPVRSRVFEPNLVWLQGSS